MKRHHALLAAAAGLVALLGGQLVDPPVASAATAAAPAQPAPDCSAGPTCSVTYTTAGLGQTFTVPSGIGSVNIALYGGHGGSDYGVLGGDGAEVTAAVAVSYPETLTVDVGGAGADPNTGSGSPVEAGGVNGGGPSGGSGSGGGATDLADGQGARLAVAGGGGGAGSSQLISGCASALVLAYGGAGGSADQAGATGEGYSSGNYTLGGGGGGQPGSTTQTNNGGKVGSAAAGPGNPCDVSSLTRLAGASGTGPDGGGESVYGRDVGGAGGGGYYGGGEGGQSGYVTDYKSFNQAAGDGGGGGGSSYTGGAGVSGAAVNDTGNNGTINGGNGEAVITYTYGPQSVAFTTNTPGYATAGGPVYQVSATGSTASGQPVTFSVPAADAGTCSVGTATVAGATSTAAVSYGGAGTCEVEANQAAGNGYGAAPQVAQSFTVAPQLVAGTVFATDDGHSRVLVEPPTGGTPTAIGSGLKAPSGVAVDAAGDVAIANTGDDQIDEIPAGGVQMAFAPAGGPYGVAYDAAGDLFYTDTDNGAIDEVPAGGGTPVLIASGLSFPGGVAVDAAGDVFAANGQSVYRIAKGTTAPVVIATEPGANQIVTDAAGNVYFVSYSGVYQIPAGGGSPAKVNPHSGSGLGLDAYGNLYIDDSGSSVTEYPADGSAAKPILSNLSQPQQMAVYVPPPTLTADTPPATAGPGAYSYTYQATAPTNEPAPTFHVASGTLPAGLSLDPNSGVLSGTPTTPGSSTFTVRASNFVTSDVSPSTTINVTSAGQTIAFNSTAPLAATAHGAAYQVSATGGASGQAVTFSVPAADASVCSLGLLPTVNGATTTQTVTFSGPGTCEIDANQGAGNKYVAAAQVSQSFPVGAASQTVMFTSTAPSSATAFGASYQVSATGGGSGLPVTFSVPIADSSVCAVSGAFTLLGSTMATVSFTGNGTCEVDANQAAGGGYAAAPQVSQSFPVGAASQTIMFTSTAPTTATAHGASYQVSAMGGGSGQPVTFAVPAADGSVCSLGVPVVSGAKTTAVVSFTGAGTCEVDANQAAGGGYGAAPQVDQSFPVAAASETVSFTSTAPTNAMAGGPTYAVSATGGASGQPVTLAVPTADGAVCSLGVPSVSGATTTAAVSFTGAGTCEVDANQAAGSGYAAAPQVAQSFPVSAAPAPVVPGAPTGLTASLGGAEGPVSLVWTAPTAGASPSGYEVFRGTRAGGETATPYATVSGTSFADAAVTPGVTYFYTVATVAGAAPNAAVSAPSNEASARVGEDPAGGARLASTPDGSGWWVLNPDNSVSAYGTAVGYGSPAAQGLHLAAPTVGITATPDGHGYWVVAADGGVFAYGDAVFHGSAGNLRLVQPVVGIAATPDGGGYWLVATDGGVFSYGDAVFHGSAGNLRLVQPVVGMTATPDGRGYWLVASDGGVFTYGAAVFYGSAGNLRLVRPIIGMTRTIGGDGYWLVASDGGIFTYGRAGFYGSNGGVAHPSPTEGIIAHPSGAGYTLVSATGTPTVFGG